MTNSKKISAGKMALFVGIACLALLAFGVFSCHKQLKPTTIKIDRPTRHYPTIVLGDDMVIEYVVRNTGNEVLVLTDVQPSCPTIEASAKNVKMIPPGDEAPFIFIFHSDKNIGLARHSIRLFGNIAPDGVAEMTFDTHVVRPSIDLMDYEEYYQKNSGPQLTEK